ncbi:MAG: polyprenol monophosphomannose synthase [Candidatus Palauibacterales bacterium]|nr:polyprenol monophosphomannose synthase [Candidatus Palauibacterales bacterium]
MRFLVIVPTYNERDNLPEILPAILAQDDRIDVLVVDDASPDGTGEIADRLARDDDRVHVLHRTGKRGLGPAYIDGFQWGLDRDYDYFLEMDADFSHDPEHLPDFLDAASEGRIVVGSRYTQGRVTVVNWPIRRLLLSYFGTVYARIATGLPVTDSTSGFKCFPRAALQDIDLGAVESNGYAFQIEMSFRAWKAGYEIHELPIVFVERESGESKMSKAIVFEAIWKVWKLRLMDMLGVL